MTAKHYLIRNRVLPALVVLGLLVYQYYLPVNQPADRTLIVDDNVVQQAYATRRSGQWVEITGRVQRILSNDNEGARHQRFIVELADGHTVLVAHNIDLADAVPVQQGQTVELRGRYEWNDRGGVIHWTHHDPDGRIQGGWIMLENTRYQ